MNNEYSNSPASSDAQPAPAHPALAHPAPTQPAPMQPVPMQPAPMQPAPMQSAPMQSTPAQPAPMQPAPMQSAPAQPMLARPMSTQPIPPQPMPAHPTTPPAPAYPTPIRSAAHPMPAHGTTSHPASRQAPPAPVKRGNKGVSFLIGLLGVITGAALTVGVLGLVKPESDPPLIVDTGSVVIDSANTDIELPVVVAAKVTPSVVNIDVYTTTPTFLLEDFFGGRSGNNSSDPQQTGLGSGVILTSDGYILTNYHVVEGGERLLVRFENEELEAILVGADPSSDLAVIKVDATGLTPIEIGNSDSVSVGQWVMAVGSPFGLEKSVSIGIVSALYRSIAMPSHSGLSIFANLIQTDAAINPGNSGGALVNSSGELIGINTLINTTSGSNAGVGFAVPSNFAFPIAEQIMKGEEVAHPFLGISLYSVDISNAQELGVNVLSGAYVDSIQPGSPAERAGLRTGDVIVSIDDTSINTSAELIIEVRGYSIGDTVTLEINRGGQMLTVEVVLGSTAD